MQLTDVLKVGDHRVTVRPRGEQDSDLLLAVYSSIREAELVHVPWSAAQKDAFVRQQFHAQDMAYRNDYPGADLLILVVDGHDAGRLYLHRLPQEIRVMDIALLPSFRAQGIGGAVLRHVQEEAARTARDVTIYVEVFNPAQRLYERLGFRRVSETQVYRLMSWRSDAPLKA